MKIDIRVECHAGYRADEYPLRFILRGRLFEIIEVEDRWYSPGTVYFRVRAEKTAISISFATTRAWTCGRWMHSEPVTNTKSRPNRWM